MCRGSGSRGVDRRPTIRYTECMGCKPNAELFDRRYRIHNKTGCWLWEGYVDKRGYGQFKYNNKQYLAHRFSWEYHTGKPIPEGMTIDHVCKVKSCVNPDHLEVVTIQENLARRDGATITHCVNGHPRSVHTKRKPGGQLYCGECVRERQREYRRRNK